MPDPNLNEDKNQAGLITNYQPRLSRPLSGNKYYIREVDGGWNGCVDGYIKDSQCGVLPNCVGYANGRFNEIGGYGSCKYQFVLNAWKTYNTAISYGLKVGQTPMLGAIMVWSNGDSPGHVAIVEKINSPTQVVTSESAAGIRSEGKTGTIFFTQVRDKGSSGNWGQDYANYKFTGFVYNPAVADYATVSSQVTDTGGPVDYQDSIDISQQSSQLYKNQTAFTTKLVSTEVTRDQIIKVDREYNDISSQSNNLLSYPSLVEAPYILVKIGDYVFGQYTEKRSAGKLYKTYPNFITGLDVMKINGQVNVYTIKMLYQVQYMDDPNFVDKILSSVGYGKIKISYGDFASPSFIYKEEEAIITKVTTNVDFSSSKIEYTISCTSSALSAQGTNYSFPRRVAKPSTVIKQILSDKQYKLDTVFPGLTGKNLQKNFYKFIATDDQVVEIPAQQYMDPISYINYLVSYMVPQEDTVSSTTRSATYYMTIHDDSYADYSNVGGTYFKVTKILSTYKTLPTFNTYTVDVGYPGGDHPGENLVMNFSLKDDNSWALLYDYSQLDISGSQSNYTYSINNQGQAIRTYSPNITQNAIHGKTTAAMKQWWTRMTEFPISATLTIKGLVRAAMLMTYLRVNTYFYGKKHVSSGLYVITKQEDRIDGSGYRTTLSLTRIAGEDEYIERKKYTQVSEVVTGIKKSKFVEPVEVESEEINSYYSRGPWGSAFQITSDIKYFVPAGTELYVVTGREGTPYFGEMFTNITQWPFVDKIVDNPEQEQWDNRQFYIRPVSEVRDNWYYVEEQHGNVYDVEYTEPSYVEKDTYGYDCQWIDSLGWNGTWVAIQNGNTVYFVPYEDKYGNKLQRITQKDE